ncbi:MAG: leucine-rich repeat domain-containing protein, partial [Clostridia bacterium]|nr:leucine-rich repeat domain-containing protein [Clostridia bacterium]
MKLRIWKKICIFALATAFASPFAACVNEDEASSLPSTESSTATESGLNSSEGRESSEAESSTEESSSSDGSSVGKDSSSSAPERVRVDCGEYSLVFTMDGEGGCFLSAVQGTPAEVVVPERVNGAAVTAIGQRIENSLIAPFLRNAAVKKITLPDTVERIAPRAFYGCTALTEIRLSKNLESLGDYAFFGCCKLQSIILPARVTRIPKYAFYRCVALEEIQADGVLQADEYAFGYCVKLSETFIQRIPAPHETTFYGYGATLYPDAAPTATVRDEAHGYELYFELHEDFLY